MKSIKICIVFSFIVCFMRSVPLNAQVDSAAADKPKEQKNFKNILRFNLTNPMLFGQYSVIFGYERTTGKHQSFSINAGQAYYPSTSIISTPDIIVKDQTNRGVHLSADYRFYLKKENKFNAPRGVYIGPYYSYNFFERKNVWKLNTATIQGDVTTDLRLNIHTIGAELGYQFVFWNRLALDLVLFGPGVATYAFKTEVNTTLSPDDEALLFEKLNDKLAEIIPGYSLNLDDAEFKKTGSTKVSNLGFRYIIHLGFRF